MRTWHGEYSWGSMALVEHPDLITFDRPGEYNWPELWAVFEEDGLPPQESLERCICLFHQCRSRQLDMEGDTTEARASVAADLRSWARFCLNHTDRLPEALLQDQLFDLAEDGSIPPRYFEYAYQAYLDALVERQARNWGSAEIEFSGEGLDEITPCLGHGRLRVFVPEDSPEMGLAADTRWQRYKKALAQRTHDEWCSAYSNLMERVRDMADERPALG